MSTILVESPPIAYTDYCILYREIKGTIVGCLKLNTFCEKMRKGKSVIITDASKEVYKYNKAIKPIKVVFKTNK